MSEEEVVLVRRVYKFADSTAITLPAFWLRQVEAFSGRRLEYVLVRASRGRLIVEPVFDEELIKKLYYRKKEASVSA
ncbi:hypothetical protein DKAM_1122 [Desulfurococcus amylolyticus 1221n]|uniref:SpoVT-AbrB domain-containing protein n=1 Tax=Desulfurococcus amylolyticus (strain DSM 18924 / JCM 16383 / VKM B-2413 / 1221n) TaxID=490899 RepID=B8D5R7_DESA1|nr:hypothetical protein [Desulfurococcus amylolyticus]ACL11448.1 hypothetical protein DKAM_1122 [Desulfurococcus amylolyticus 1221n]